MDFLSYRKAEQILIEKEIKEAIILLPKILTICIKKGLDFSFCENVKVIDVRNLKTGFCLTGYYSENLVNYESKENGTFTVKSIYNKLKDYKKEL